MKHSYLNNLGVSEEVWCARVSLHVWQEDGSTAAGLLPNPAQPSLAWCCLVRGNPRHADGRRGIQIHTDMLTTLTILCRY